MPHMKKIYRMKRLVRFVPLLQIPVIVSMVILCIFLTLQTLHTPTLNQWLPLISLVAMTLFFAYASFILSGIYLARLELSEEGITFYGASYRLYTPWHNIATIGRQTIPFRGSIRTLELREPARIDIPFHEAAQRGQAVIARRWKLMLVSPSSLKALSSSLPLIVISKRDWEQGDFLHYLKIFAPHLQRSDP